MCAGDWEPRAAAYCLLLGELANGSAAIMLTDLLNGHSLEVAVLSPLMYGIF